MVDSDVIEYCSIIISETTVIFSLLVARSFGLPFALKIRQRKHLSCTLENTNFDKHYETVSIFAILKSSISSFLTYPQVNATKARETLVISFLF